MLGLVLVERVHRFVPSFLARHGNRQHFHHHRHQHGLLGPPNDLLVALLLLLTLCHVLLNAEHFVDVLQLPQLLGLRRPRQLQRTRHAS